MTHVIGSGNTTPGDGVAPVTLRTDPLDAGDDTTGLTVTYNASAPADQPALLLVDRDGTTPILEVLKTAVHVYNRKLGCIPEVGSSVACLNGTQDPVCIELASGARWWAGTGPPDSSTVGTGRVSDLFFDIDGTVYYCSTAGTPGTWTAL